MLKDKQATKQIVDHDMLEKAKRVQSARKFAGLTRDEMNNRHAIPPSTLRGWECPGTLKNQGLTSKGAQRLAKALLTEGVICSAEWLLDGKGIGPYFISTLSIDKNENSFAWHNQLAIQKEIKFFEENNLHSLVLMLSDDSLEPFYRIGDYVGGVKKYSLKEINALDGCFCIVETIEKEVFIRKLISEKKSGLFSLLCINPSTTASEPIKNNVQLKWAAPIIWHRKP